ncbi:hypothetical protein [Geotoga petraea]|uniref:Uncharacterized protein n=1 Tax=Geotoga petraea TaxID=28234 RepID=A0A1G6LUA0_9BACT|nr:hypothetical protein [Geotoga petraea]SDC46781.1 hypothetical protein SAMN04488588_1147 [Geotoga petraea]
MKKIIFIGLVVVLLLLLLSCTTQKNFENSKIKSIETIEENTGVRLKIIFDSDYPVPTDDVKMLIRKNGWTKTFIGNANSDNTEYTFEATNINPGTQFNRKIFIEDKIIYGDSLGEFETKVTSDSTPPIIVENNYSLEETGDMASPLTLEIDEKPSGVKEALIKLTRIDEYGKFEEPRTIYLENELMTFEWSTNKSMSYFLTDPTPPSTWNYYIKIIDNSGNTTITDIGTLTHTN